MQCRALSISALGYHQDRLGCVKIAQWRRMADETPPARSRVVHAENHGSCGWRRIWRELREQGLRLWVGSGFVSDEPEFRFDCFRCALRPLCQALNEREGRLSSRRWQDNLDLIA